MTEPKPRFQGHLPQRTAIDAYGNGGFRFAGMSHRGSLLMLADGVWAWPAKDPADLTLALLQPLLGRMALPQFLLLGTGRRQVFPPADVRAAFLEARIGLDVMDTGAAARTFNVLLAEGRPVNAALLAVE